MLDFDFSLQLCFNFQTPYVKFFLSCNSQTPNLIFCKFQTQQIDMDPIYKSREYPLYFLNASYIPASSCTGTIKYARNWVLYS